MLYHWVFQIHFGTFMIMHVHVLHWESLAIRLYAVHLRHCHLLKMVLPLSNCFWRICWRAHNTISQCLLYNMSHTAVSLVLYAVDLGHMAKMSCKHCYLFCYVSWSVCLISGFRSLVAIVTTCVVSGETEAGACRCTSMCVYECKVCISYIEYVDHVKVHLSSISATYNEITTIYKTNAKCSIYTLYVLQNITPTPTTQTHICAYCVCIMYEWTDHHQGNRLIETCII